MRKFYTLIGLILFLVFSVIYASSIGTLQKPSSSTLVTFRHFPNNSAWKDSIISIAAQSNDPKTVQNRSRNFLDRKKIVSAQILFNLKGQKPYLWVYDKAHEKNIAIFATRSNGKTYKNISLLLETWKDSLYVFDELIIAIDSSIYQPEIVTFKALNNIESKEKLRINQLANTTFIGPSAPSTIHAWHDVELTHASRKERCIIHFFSDEEKRAFQEFLKEYIPYSYTTNEYISILLSEFPNYKTIDPSSLEKYITQLKGQ